MIINYNVGTMGNIFLILTILSETAAVIFMKSADGFQNKVYSIIAVVTYGLSFIFLTLALKTMPAGIANGIWAGASTILVTIAGILIFKEKLSTVQVVSILFIVIGLAGLHFSKSPL